MRPDLVLVLLPFIAIFASALLLLAVAWVRKFFRRPPPPAVLIPAGRSPIFPAQTWRGQSRGFAVRAA